MTSEPGTLQIYFMFLNDIDDDDDDDDVDYNIYFKKVLHPFRIPWL